MQQSVSPDTSKRDVTGDRKPEEAMKSPCTSLKLSMIAAPAAAITFVKAAVFAGILNEGPRLSAPAHLAIRAFEPI
jgi:hypothetical protein